MENNVITKLILAFVVLIVGISLIGSIATNANAVTKMTGVSGETTIDLALDRDLVSACGMGLNGTYEYTLTNAPTGWKASGACPITNFVLLNETGVAATVTTDYTFFPDNGSVFLKNTTTGFVEANCSATATGVSNTTTAFYDYCGNDYLSQAWSRTIINLIAGFFALALLGASVGLFYSIGKDTGIIN